MDIIIKNVVVFDTNKKEINNIIENLEATKIRIMLDIVAAASTNSNTITENSGSGFVIQHGRQEYMSRKLTEDLENLCEISNRLHLLYIARDNIKQVRESD